MYMNVRGKALDNVIRIFVMILEVFAWVSG